MEPDVWPARPIRLEVPLRLVPEPPGHRWPGAGQHQLPHLTDRWPAVRVKDCGSHARSMPGEAAFARLHQRASNQNAAPDLGASRPIDDRHQATADVPVQPAPGLRSPALSSGAQDTQASELTPVDPLPPVAGQQAHERGRQPEVRELVPFHKPPEAVRLWEVRRTLEEDQRGPEGQYAPEAQRTHDSAQYRDPAEAGHLALVQTASRPAGLPA